MRSGVQVGCEVRMGWGSGGAVGGSEDAGVGFWGVGVQGASKRVVFGLAASTI